MLEYLDSWKWSIFLNFLVVTFVGLFYENSSTFRYYFKFGVYVAICSVVGLFMIPFSLFRPRDVRNVLIGVPFVRLICPLVGIKWVISGSENLAADFPCVIVSNHQSAWDFMVICELWPIMQKCACVAKRAIMYVFPFGFAAWLCGTVYINRSDAKDSRTKISQTAEQIQEKKTKMWIFPEGTRSKRCDLLPFKKGAFHIAAQNKLPVVPVIISPYTFINDSKKIFNSGKVLVTVLPPISTSSIETAEEVGELTERIRTIMNTEYHRLTQLVLQEAGKEAVNDHPSAAPVAFESGKRRS